MTVKTENKMFVSYLPLKKLFVFGNMEKKLFVVAMGEKKLRAAEHSSGPPWISNGSSLKLVCKNCLQL